MEDLELKKFSATGRDVELLAMHPAIAAIAEQAVSFLQVHNAENYVQFDLMPRIDRGTRPIRFTVQWASGLSPAEKARKLAEQLADLRSRATVDKITEYAGLLDATRALALLTLRNLGRQGAGVDLPDPTESLHAGRHAAALRAASDPR